MLIAVGLRLLRFVAAIVIGSVVAIASVLLITAFVLLLVRLGVA